MPPRGSQRDAFRRIPVKQTPDADEKAPTLIERIASVVGNLLPASIQPLLPQPCGQILYGERKCEVETARKCKCGAVRCTTHLNGQCPDDCDESAEGHEHRQGQCNECFMKACQSGAMRDIAMGGGGLGLFHPDRRRDGGDSRATQIRDRFFGG